MFESCFDGLDLSEFDNFPNQERMGNGSKHPSAAAALARVKALEAARLEKDAREEAQMIDNATKLAREQIKRRAAPSESIHQNKVQWRKNVVGSDSASAGTSGFSASGFYSNLVHMHGGDNNGANREHRGCSSVLKKATKKKPGTCKREGKSKQSTLRQLQSSSTRNRPKGLVKKSRKMKH